MSKFIFVLKGYRLYLVASLFSIIDEQVHQDYSGCSIPHIEGCIFSNIDTNWLDMMKKVKNQMIRLMMF